MIQGCNKIQSFLGIFLSLLAYNAFASIDTGASLKRSDDLKPIRKLFSLPEDEIDFAEARLIIENLVDSSIDISENLKEIDQIIEKIKRVPRYSEDIEGKLNGIIQYLYMSGNWNDNQPYHYDFDDPLGTSKPENSRLSNYLRSHTGNCVSMPILVLILGQKLGLDMSLSTAPLHLFVRLHNEGQFYNFEATAGGLKAESSYVKEFMITPDAIKNGVYLKNLSKKQILTVMLSGLAKQYSESTQNKEFDKAFELTSLMLKHYPSNVTAMIIRGNIWRNILHRDLKSFKEKRMRMTSSNKQHFDELLSRNLQWYEKAESLGWYEPAKNYEERYLKMINEARKSYE